MSYVGNIKNKRMGREEEEDMEIYANVDPMNSSGVRTEAENSDTRHQTPQDTGNDSEKIRSSRAALVCLVLLCFLLLTAVIVLSVHINKNNTNYRQERHQLLTNITSLTEKREQLLTNITSLKEEREQLLTNITSLTEEREQQHAKHMQLTSDRDGLSSNNRDLIKQNNQLNQEKNELMKMDEWIFYRSSVYYVSDANKSWTESRSYCTARGADLTIINNREEQDFVTKISAGAKVWIGLTDSKKEGSWEWVDGRKPTSGFWHHKEPDSNNGMTDEDCALTVSGWADYPCNDNFQWICEKIIFK